MCFALWQGANALRLCQTPDLHRGFSKQYEPFENFKCAETTPPETEAEKPTDKQKAPPSSPTDQPPPKRATQPPSKPAQPNLFVVLFFLIIFQSFDTPVFVINTSSAPKQHHPNPKRKHPHSKRKHRYYRHTTNNRRNKRHNRHSKTHNR